MCDGISFYFLSCFEKLAMVIHISVPIKFDARKTVNLGRSVAKYSYSKIVFSLEKINSKLVSSTVNDVIVVDDNLTACLFSSVAAIALCLIRPHYKFVYQRILLFEYSRPTNYLLNTYFEQFLLN